MGINDMIQFNKVISISSIIIFYEIFILILFLFNAVNKKFSTSLVSWAVVLNFFIIFVMFLTDCKIDTKTKLWVVTIKTILLFLVLLIADFSLKNYLIGLTFLIIYYFVSDIDKVYSCNVKLQNLFLSLVFASIIYFLLAITQHTTTKSKN